MTLNIPGGPVVESISPYERLGFTDLPFPSLAVLDPYSNDPRRNGSIYAQAPVMAAIKQFESLLIRSNDFPNRARIASLWSAGDSVSGRGMGKTALLRFFQRRINVDWGVTEFQGRFFAVVIYVAFPDQVERRWMEQLAWSALVDVCRGRVLDVARASLRRQLLTEEQVAAVVTLDDETDWSRLLNDDILERHDILPGQLDDQIEVRLSACGVEQPVAGVLSDGTFPEHLRSLRKDGNLMPYYVPRDTKGLDYSRTLLFNDLVRYLRCAGFAGGYLFVDDIENLTDQMGRRDRTEFVKEFGLCAVRPGYANTEHEFFSCVLTTHQQSVLGIAQAWSEAGLSAVAPMNPGAPTSIELPLPNADQASAIITAHLDHYRINPEDVGQINPFTESGLQALIAKSQHPRELLTNAAHVMMQVVLGEANDIDASMVEQVFSGTVTASVTDHTYGVEEAL